MDIETAIAPEPTTTAPDDTSADDTSRDTYGYTGSYSPEDNKLRLYSATWLPKPVYNRIYAAGYRWAPKQKLFVAPRWTPYRADLLAELCGDIEEESDSLSGRAEFRARRFDGYRDNRLVDAELGYQRLETLTGGSVRDGRPLISAHHREERAHRVANRIERVAEHTLTKWDTAEYWKERVSAVLAHAEFKERADVRARRIKGIETDRRREEKRQKESKLLLSLWRKLGEPGWLKHKGEPVIDIRQQALFIANRDHISREFPLATYPRDPPASQYEGAMGLWSALDGNVITPAQAAELAIASHERRLSRMERWLNHYEHRITFERAMLAAQGSTHLLDKKPRPKQLPLCNYKAPEGLQVPNPYHRGEINHYPQVEMTAAEYAKIYSDYKGTRVIGNSHRVRTAMLHRPRTQLVCVFITDSKTHERPAPIEPAAPKRTAPAPRPPVIEEPEPEQSEQFAKFKRLCEQMEGGVQVVQAPQLFASPPPVANRVIEVARIGAGHRVLEPSAGTGALIRAMGSDVLSGAHLVAVEIAPALAEQLRRYSPPHEVICANFLDCGANGGDALYTVGVFDRIVMNPPFSQVQDIQHVEHALGLLATEGRLVAVMFNDGSAFADEEADTRRGRRITALRARVEASGRTMTVEELPDNSFASQDTRVSAVLVTIE